MTPPHPHYTQKHSICQQEIDPPYNFVAMHNKTRNTKQKNSKIAQKRPCCLSILKFLKGFRETFFKKFP